MAEKIRFHSVSDFITNSSNVTYTYSNDSLGALKEMINEIFRLCGVDKKCDDVFWLSVDFDDAYTYLENIEESDIQCLPEEGNNEQVDFIKDTLSQLRRGEIKKPTWLKNAEDQANDNDFTPSTVLIIESKLPEYQHLATLIKKFLYSVSYESIYNG